MRNAFADEITRIAQEDERVVLLSGDIGNRLFNTFKEKAGERFLNCGVAEANMIGTAAGMALNGMKPVAYTIAPFLTLRCLEHIRIDVCYQNAPVVIVGVGSGLSYASLGPTHHSCEDIACLRALPNMTVMCPADALEVREALKAALDLNGPVYMRIGKKGEPAVHQSAPRLSVGESITIRNGADAAVLSTGTILPNVLDACERLESQGVSCRVEHFHTVKPLDEKTLKNVFDNYSVIVTVEEHGRIGGFGGAVAEWLADRPTAGKRLVRLGTPDRFFHHAGSQAYLLEQSGLSPERIAEAVLTSLNGDRP